MFFFTGSLSAQSTDIQSPDRIFSRLTFATPQLSVRLIKQQLSKLEAGSETWLVWEKKHLELLSQLGDWQQIISRITQHQQKIADDERARFILLKATAKLKVSQSDAVRAEIRNLIWSDIELTTEQMALARRLIIRSYLLERQPKDAQRAMLRYQQDYGEGGLEWKVLQTKVLLATKRYQQAVHLIAKEKDQSVQALKQLTRMKAGFDASQHTYKQAIKAAQQATSVDLDAPVPLQLQNLSRQNWILGFIAAGINNDFEAEIEALENALVTGIADADSDLVAINASLLWQKYQHYAQYLANKHHLLIGDNTAWFQYASDRIEKQPVVARSLFAYLGLIVKSQEQRWVSLEQLSALISKKSGQGIKLIDVLFSDPTLFSGVEEIPVNVRYLLLDDALSRGKIKRAANLFEFLPEPPVGKKRLAWDLRRARVLVLGGEYKAAATILHQLLKNEKLDELWLNRLMQVVFDFQKVEQHELAILLFKNIEAVNDKPEFQRELKFWLAESHQALKQYESAAHLYLTSAMMLADKQFDPWAQTARFKAAEVLTLAGLIDDARSLFQQLLKNTSNKTRKTVIRQKLQQLWLLEGMQSRLTD